ncbi:hypothetical protein JCM17823_28910 [Halorubrum gandharaense]
MKNHLLLGVGLLGLIELIAPKQVVALFTRIAYRNADDAEPRSWLHTAARVEGLVLVVAALVGLFKSAQGATTAANAAADTAADRSADHDADGGDG